MDLSIGNETVDQLMRRLRAWAPNHEGIVAIALAGSRARGNARPDSDVDVVVVASHPGRWIDDASGWVGEFGLVERLEYEAWGVLQAVRVFYRNGTEIEFGLVAPTWAGTQPVDAGTATVVRDGIRVVYDPHRLLTDLVRACRE